MLKKKESFIKYLQDDFPKKKIPQKKPSKEQIDNNKNSKNNESNDKKSEYSFQNFVEQIKNFDYNKKIKWDSAIHKSCIIEDKKKYKIKLTELFSVNYTNPLLTLNKDYCKPKYQISFFEQEILNLEDKIKINKDNNIKNYSNILIDNLIEKREKYELNKKIINYYLLYFAENNFETIAPSITKIQQLKSNVELYYDKVINMKKKIHKLKKSNIDNTIKLILKKTKIENLYKLLSIMKNNILSSYKNIKSLKLKLMNFDYIKYSEEINIQSKNITSINEKISKIMVGGDKKIKIFEVFCGKMKKKREKFNRKYNSEIENIFDSKNSNILQLYYLFDLDSNINLGNNGNSSHINLFVTKMEKNFKLKSKKLILETVHKYKKTEKAKSNSITIFNLNKQKLSDINNIHIEVNNLINCTKNIFSKLKCLVDILLYYINLINDSKDSKYDNLKNEMKIKKKEFYDKLDKYLSKLVKLFYNQKKDNKAGDKIIPKKIFLIILNLFCLFGKLLKIKFGVDYSKYLNLSLKNYIVNQIKFENRCVLDKSLILLENEVWNKFLLDSNYFQIEVIKQQIPLYLKKFVVYLNEDEIEDEDMKINDNIDQNNIDDIFNHINIIDNSNENIDFDAVVDLYNKKDGIKILNNTKEINILDKPLKYNNLFIVNSSTCIIRGIEEQIVNLIMFDYLTYEIFSYLFTSVDLYIFILFNMFMIDKKYITSLLRKINFNEVQNDIDNLDYWSELTSYQLKYSEIKKFCSSAEKKICELYGNNNKFTSNEERQNFIESLIPKLKEDNLKDQTTDNDENMKNKNEKEEDKNKKLGFLGFVKSAVDDIGNGISKGKETAINFFQDKNSKESKESKELREKITISHFKQIVIFISCISTIYKILKRLIGFTSKIELDFQKNQIIEKISKYKTLIQQIKYFFYMKISLAIFDFTKISQTIEDFKWAPSQEEGSAQLFEASPWVGEILKYFNLIMSEITSQYTDFFGEKNLKYYFSMLIRYIISNIQESFSKIKNCNDTGRSIMLKDIKFLKQGIEDILSKYNYKKLINTNELFDIILKYINEWYNNCDDLIKFFLDNNIKYKYFQSFLDTSPNIINLSSEKKNEFLNKVKQKYLLHIKKAINFLRD